MQCCGRHDPLVSVGDIPLAPRDSLSPTDRAAAALQNGFLEFSCVHLDGDMSRPADTTLCCIHRTDLERVLGTNVVGAFATIQAFYALLKVLLSRKAFFFQNPKCLHKVAAHKY